jgi:trigger factor
MAVTVETLEKLERKISLSLPVTVIQSEVDARLKKMAPHCQNGRLPSR